MKRHLSSREIVEAVESGLGPRRQRHLDACVRCQEQLRGFEASLEAIRTSDDVPEPPPFFWESLRERVRTATDGERIPARGWSFWSWRSVAVALPALVAIVLLVAYGTGPGGGPNVPPAPDPPRVVLEPAGALPAVPPDQPAWEDVAALAADVPADAWELAQPTAAEAAGAILEALTAEERTELARLLREAIGGGA